MGLFIYRWAFFARKMGRRRVAGRDGLCWCMLSQGNIVQREYIWLTTFYDRLKKTIMFKYTNCARKTEYVDSEKRGRGYVS